MRSRFALVLAGALLLGLGPGIARADWLQPDPSYREAQIALRFASRDTIGHPDDPVRLDSLGVALLRLTRFADAARVFRRTLALQPGDDAAEAGLGKIALFEDRLAEAESLLAQVADADLEVIADLFAARVRRGEYAKAAELAELANQQGRAVMLQRMAEKPTYQMSGKTEISHPWVRAYPVPLIRVKLNGESVLMAIDLGAGDVLLDISAAKRTKVEQLSGQRLDLWCGTRLAVRNAMIQRLEIGGIKLQQVPAGILSLRKYGLEVNPQAEPVAGVIGIHLLRCFTPTIDYRRNRLELKPLDAPIAAGPGATRIPFQVWGESELMVYGSLAGGRRMAFVFQTGVPSCGVGAPAEVFDEIGVKAGAMAKLVKGAGQWLQGRPWTAVTVPNVTVGALVKDRVAGWRGALDSSEMWRHGVRRDALLSNEMFRDWRLTVDWKSRELVFEE